MQNITLYSIPPEVVFNNVLPYAADVTVIKIVSYARTTKVWYNAFIKTIKGLWDRTVVFSPDEIKQNPLLPLLKLIDGRQRLSSAIALHEKHRGLFNNIYEPFGSFLSISQERAIYQALTIETYEKKLFTLDHLDPRRTTTFQTAENQLKNDLRRAVYLPKEIFRSRALVVLNFLAGFFDAIPFFLPTLVFLGGRDLVARALIAIPVFLVLIYWLIINKDNINDMWSSVSNFLADNLTKGFTNRKMLNTSSKYGFSIAILAIALIVGFEINRYVPIATLLYCLFNCFFSQ